MENASKALLMSAGILLAILLIGVATRLFNSAIGVARTYDQTMQTAEISEFNAKFTKFVDTGSGEGTNKKESATIYEIISLANFANDYNHKIDTDPAELTKSRTNRDPAVIEVAITKTDGTVYLDNLQNHSDIYTKLLSQCYYTDNVNPTAKNIITFKVEEIKNNGSGRVNYISFKPENKGNINTKLQNIKNW